MIFIIYVAKIFSEPQKIIWCSLVSLTKKEYGSAVHSLNILVRSSVLMSDEWFSSLLLGIFAIKKWLVFSLTSFGTLKYD